MNRSATYETILADPEEHDRSLLFVVWAAGVNRSSMILVCHGNVDEQLISDFDWGRHYVQHARTSTAVRAWPDPRLTCPHKRKVEAVTAGEENRVPLVIAGRTLPITVRPRPVDLCAGVRRYRQHTPSICIPPLAGQINRSSQDTARCVDLITSVQ